jgi:hypothetical protein
MHVNPITPKLSKEELWCARCATRVTPSSVPLFSELNLTQPTTDAKIKQRHALPALSGSYLKRIRAQARRLLLLLDLLRLLQELLRELQLNLRARARCGRTPASCMLRWRRGDRRQQARQVGGRAGCGRERRRGRCGCGRLLLLLHELKKLQEPLPRAALNRPNAEVDGTSILRM